MGFEFHKESPIRVDSVQPKSYAEKLGIQKGWVIKQINGEDMDGKNFDTKYQHLLA